MKPSGATQLHCPTAKAQGQIVTQSLSLQEDNSTLVSAGRQARQLAVWTFDSLHRLQTHHATWPSVLHDLVRDAVTDLAKPTYGKQCLEDVKRTLGWKK